MKLSKMFSKKGRKMVNLMLVLGLVIVAAVLFRYNYSKSRVNDSMVGNSKLSANAQVLNMAAPKAQEGAELGVSASESLKKDPFMKVSGMETPKAAGTCNNQPLMDPKELLPQDKNSEWAKINPANGDLKNLNMLSAGHHYGINTVGSSLRNANLQLRSEPAIPQVDVGPWNNTTIEPDNLRRPLEIGGQE
jgi:hypothetical protein